MADKITELVKRANSQLKALNNGVLILKRGSKLSLRGMMPPKSGSGKPERQIISLGIYANGAGIKQAKLEAQKLGAAIALKEFNWDDY